MDDDPASGLVGRERELAALAALIDARESGGVIAMLVGDPGIGKSRLLEAATAFARRSGVRVLSTTGIGSESSLPYAALHGMLRPLLGRAGQLPVRQRDALLAAFGQTDAAPTDLFLVALAALELLADAAMPTGLLVTVDDLHLVDHASTDVLAFVARRIDAEPLLVMTVIRTGYPQPPGLDGKRVAVGPLTDDEAASLIEQRAPGLAAPIRRAVLDGAEGNPLALLELPAALASAPRGWREPLLPLSTRLELAFADRIAALAATGQLMLLAAVVTETGDLDQTIATATQLTGRAVGLDDLEDAFVAGLVRVEGGTLQFRHPLVRSAIYRAADPRSRRSAHAVLATLLAGEPDRQAWQLAHSIIGRDADVADALERTGERARRRGAPGAALKALRRAAELSVDAEKRADRLLTATELAVETGQPDAVTEMLEHLRTSTLTAVQGAHLAWIRELREDGIELRTDLVFRLVALARTCQEHGALELALKILHAAALRCWWGTDDVDAVDEIARCADNLPVPQDVPSMQFILAAVRPAQRGPEVLEALRHAVSDGTGSAVASNVRGLAAVLLGDMELCSRNYEAAEGGYRQQGQLGRLAQVLVSHAAASVFRGHFRAARDAADEAIALSRDLAGPRWHAAVLMTTTAADACLGNPVELSAVEPTLESLANPAQWAQLAHTLGLVALAEGRYADAYEHLRPMMTPGERCYHPTFRTWVVADLVEAAGHCDRLDDMPDVVVDLGRLSIPSPLLAAGMAYARAALAKGGEADHLFHRAIGQTVDYPFLCARAELHYGSWLRRRHRSVDARAVLRAAVHHFDALGVLPWSRRARAELFAAGGRTEIPVRTSLTQLTAQEMRIGRLAAEGLTNREIGQQLYLSHRTVSSHLYRIFPKLGITRRSQLRDAMAGEQLHRSLQLR